MSDSDPVNTNEYSNGDIVEIIVDNAISRFRINKIDSENGTMDVVNIHDGKTSLIIIEGYELKIPTGETFHSHTKSDDPSIEGLNAPKKSIKSNYRIIVTPKESYTWPSHYLRIEDNESKFLEYVKIRRSRIRKALSIGSVSGNKAPPKIYPGDDSFWDVPDDLLYYIGEYELLIDDFKTKSRNQLLRQVWESHGNVLDYINFFRTSSVPLYIEMISSKTLFFMENLPDWVRPIYQKGLDSYLTGEEYTCMAGSEICRKIATDSWSQLLGDVTSIKIGTYRLKDFLKDDILSSLWNSLFTLEIFYETELGGHILTINTLIEPRQSTNLKLRYFVCQSYVYQNALIIEEVNDVISYLTKISELPEISDENLYKYRHEELFHATIGRIPEPDEWIEYPTINVYNIYDVEL